MQVKARVMQLIRDVKAATAIEYGLMAMLIALALLGSLHAVGGEVVAMWTEVAEKTPG